MTTVKKQNKSRKASDIDIIELDAEGQVLGRLATQVAKYLQGKHKPNYQPNQAGDTVVKLKNIKKIEVTGKKEKDKIYWSHSGYAGGIYGKTYEEVFKKNPKRVVEYAVSGMLPKNKLRKERMKRLIMEP